MFIEKVEQLKKELGSYSKVAEKIGITRASLSAIKRGLTHPSEQTIINLCLALDIEPHQMIIENEVEKNTGEVKNAWAEIEKKLASIAASILAFSALPALFNGAQCILCKIAGFNNSAMLKPQ